MEDQLIKSVNNHLMRVMEKRDAIVSHTTVVQSLIEAGEARRLDRTDRVKVVSASFKGGRLFGKVVGSSGTEYLPHIAFEPKRGHFCTCPDWERRGRSVGPCKHVLALGQYWMDERLIPALEKLDHGLSAL